MKFSVLVGDPIEKITLAFTFKSVIQSWPYTQQHVSMSGVKFFQEITITILRNEEKYLTNFIQTNKF
jgi:hypothetical protein